MGKHGLLSGNGEHELLSDKGRARQAQEMA